MAVVAAAGGGTCNKREGVAPPPAPTAHWLPSPNVTLLGVPRSVEKELLALNATGKQFECKDSRKTKISFDKVCVGVGVSCGALFGERPSDTSRETRATNPPNPPTLNRR